jgi:hypothetical protein
MKLGKMLSVGEVVEHTAEPETEPASVPTPLAEPVSQGSLVTNAVTEVAELPTPVAAHADR